MTTWAFLKENKYKNLTIYKIMEENQKKNCLMNTKNVSLETPEIFKILFILYFVYHHN